MKRGVALAVAAAVLATGCGTGDGLGEREVRLALPGQDVELTMDG